MAQELSFHIEELLKKIQNSELVEIYSLAKLAKSIRARIMIYDLGNNSDTDLFCNSIANSNVTTTFIKLYNLKKTILKEESNEEKKVKIFYSVLDCIIYLLFQGTRFLKNVGKNIIENEGIGIIIDEYEDRKSGEKKRSWSNNDPAKLLYTLSHIFVDSDLKDQANSQIEKTKLVERLIKIIINEKYAYVKYHKLLMSIYLNSLKVKPFIMKQTAPF